MYMIGAAARLRDESLSLFPPNHRHSQRGAAAEIRHHYLLLLSASVSGTAERRGGVHPEKVSETDIYILPYLISYLSDTISYHTYHIYHIYQRKSDEGVRGSL